MITRWDPLPCFFPPQPAHREALIKEGVFQWLFLSFSFFFLPQVIEESPRIAPIKEYERLASPPPPFFSFLLAF